MNRGILISNTVQAIPPSGIRKFFDLILGMEGVISLGVGEPDFTTPWHICDAAIYSLEQGCTSYTSNAGLLELRERLSDQLVKDYGLKYSPQDEILITVGVSEGLDLALRAIINPGDEVIIPEPSYVSYKACTMLAGGTPIPVATNHTKFKVTKEQIEKVMTNKTKAIILSYPSNPTGVTMTQEELLEIADMVRKYDLIVISDEIYSLLTYDDIKHTPFASLPGMKEMTILLNGFSKGYAMTGWRIGYAAANKEIIAAMTKIHQYTMLCASIISQKAAIEAVQNGQPQEMIVQYNHRRKVIVEGLNEIGLECDMPGGAFYAFPSIKTTNLSSEKFAERLLFEEKVAVIPGNVFGDCGEGYIRCSYATSMEKIEKALVRIEKFVRNVRGIS